MGNSGSIHNVAVGLEDSHHPYNYHQQFHDQPQGQYQHQAQYPLHWTPSYSSNGSGGGTGVLASSHVKVLPEPSKLSRLRPTTNGDILHSGGTISGRRELTNSTQVLQRSKTTLNESPGYFRRTASGQYAEKNVNVRASAYPIPIPAWRAEVKEVSGDAVSKRFGSEPDLRTNVEEEINNHNAKNARLPSPSKSKIVKGKKKLAAPTPSSFNNDDNAAMPSNPPQPQRKLRLFKTKAESRKIADRPISYQNPKIASEASNSHFRRFDSSDQPPAPARRYLPAKDEPVPKKREDTKAKPHPPVFRREKSFDITLLRNRNNNVQSSEDLAMVPSPVPPTKQPVSRQRSVDNNEFTKNIHMSTFDPKMGRARKFSQSGLVMESERDFKKELEAATKRRSQVTLGNSEQMHDSEDFADPNLKSLQKGSSSNSRHSRVSPKTPNRKEPEHNQSQVNSNHENKRIGAASKIPQLTKTFYFGMEKPTGKSTSNEDTEISPSNQIEKSDNFAKIQMDVIDQFAKSIFTPEYQRAESESSESALSSEEGCHVMPRNETSSYDDDRDNDNQIQVHIRPTLPRKQLEIPRFSPAAAWRMLHEDRFPVISQHNSSEVNSTEAQLLASQSTQPIEGRIQRIYREPNPIYPDNKSGDSGISGDAGLAERAESPKNQRLVANVGPFLTAWTPQQDLEEDEEDEDSSSDGDLGQGSKTGANKFPSRGHTFSLSLPRENQLSFYEEKDKSGFSSLQKLKRTVSGVFANQIGSNRSSPNIRNDNWLLSRSEPNSIDNSQMSIPLDISNGQDSTNPSSNTLSYLTAGRHMMYLPNQPLDEFDRSDFPKEPMSLNITTANHADIDDDLNERIAEVQNNKMGQSKTNGGSELVSLEQHETSPGVDEGSGKAVRKNRGGHRFTFQSTVRQIERRRIADKLSKEAEQKEAQRISEVEAMRRVEEEFQRKRAGEKASIRHQLRLFSLEENQCTSLPVDWQVQQTLPNKMTRRDPSPPYHSQQQRAEPDGAVSSSPTSSPTLHSYTKMRMNSKDKTVETRAKAQQAYVKNDEPKIRSSLRPRQQKQPSPQTENLSDFRKPNREYFDYRSANGSNYRKVEQTELHETVRNIPMTTNVQQQMYDRYRETEANLNDRRYLPEMPYHGSKKLSRFQPPSG